MIDPSTLDAVVRRFRLMLQLARRDGMGDETKHLAKLMRPLIIGQYRQMTQKTGVNQNGMDNDGSGGVNHNDQRCSAIVSG